MSNDTLIPITADLIREMRTNGFEEEANKLLLKYHEIGQKNKKRIKKEISKKDKKIKVLFGQCSAWCTKKAIEGKSLCKVCAIKRKNNYSNQVKSVDN